MNSMRGLRKVTTAGIVTFIPEDFVFSVVISATGVITNVNYAVAFTGAGDVALAVAQYNGANDLWELGSYNHDRVWSHIASNRPATAL